MATNNNSARTTLAMRAAVTAVVCVALAFCGCRAPWRTWRNEEPSLEQLLMHPEPWDAEARLQQESANRRAGSAQNGGKREGRKNPYAAGRDEAARDTLAQRDAGADADDDRDDDKADEASRAEFEAAYAAAPPHLRGLLKRQWDATQARNAKLRTDDIAADDDEEEEDDRRASEDSGENVAVARRRPAGHGPVSFHLSDNDESATDTDESHDDARAGEAPPMDTPARSRAIAATQRPASPEGTVTYSLEKAERAGNAKQSPEDLAPPPVKKAARQVAHAEPVDTGAGDDVLVKPIAPRSARHAQQTASAPEKSAPAKRATAKSAPADSPSAQAANYVATAAAEMPTDPGATPASAAAPSMTDEKQEPQPAEMAWRDHLREALRQLDAESENASGDAKDNPAEQLHRQATSRMLRLALGELEPALKPIEGLQSHEQEFFRHEFQALYDAIDPKGNPVLSRRWTLALDSHRKALAHLSAVSNLEIKNANFCTDVHSYGVISKFTSPHFKPNQELLLYCELDNFSAEPVKDGFETQLQGSYEIVDASGRRVADMLLPEDVDICRNPRRDYFIAYRIYVPQKIEPGRYQLRLTIEDMKGRKFGQSSLDFQIAP